LFWGFAGSKLRKILAGRRFCWKRLRASKKGAQQLVYISDLYD